MYARIENNSIAEFSLNEWDIRTRFQDRCLPVNLLGNLPDGYVYVMPGTKPTADEYHEIIEVYPSFDGANWIQTWEIRERFTEEERQTYDAEKLATKWVNLRAERDERIKDSDWLVSRHRDQVDAGITPTLDNATYQGWLVYRQELRDLPDAITDPYNVNWPSKPSELST